METVVQEPAPPAAAQDDKSLASVESNTNSANTPEKRRLSVKDKTTAASETGKYDKSKHGNEHKDDIWWEQRGSKANKHMPQKDPKAPSPSTGHFLTPTAATVLGSKAKYSEPETSSPAAPSVRAIPQESHLLAPTPASLHGRAHDDTVDPNRKDVTAPKLAPVPAQYKEVSSKLHEPTAAVKAATFVKSEKPAVDEREKKWVANTNRANAMSTPPANEQSAPKAPSEKRSAEQSTLLRATAASKASSIEGAVAPPPPPVPAQERYVNEEYSNVPSRLYEPTVAAKLTKREKAKPSPTKAFSAGAKVVKSEDGAKQKPVDNKYSDVPARLHETTKAAEARKFKKPEEEEEPKRRKSTTSSISLQSHVLQPTSATTHGAYHKPEQAVDEHKKTKPIRRDSHLLTPTPASQHGSKNDPTVVASAEPPRKPTLEQAPEYQYVQSRLHEDTAAHKNSAYVKKDKPTVDVREAHWDGSAKSTSPMPGSARASPVPVNSEYSSVPSRLHQDTAAHKNSVYVKKEDLPPVAPKDKRRNSHSGATRRLSNPSAGDSVAPSERSVSPASTVDTTAHAAEATPAEATSTAAPAEAISTAAPAEAMSTAASAEVLESDTTGEEVAPDEGSAAAATEDAPTLQSASSEATDVDGSPANAAGSGDEEDKSFSIGDLKEGVEQLSVSCANGALGSENGNTETQETF